MMLCGFLLGVSVGGCVLTSRSTVILLMLILNTVLLLADILSSSHVFFHDGEATGQGFRGQEQRVCDTNINNLSLSKKTKRVHTKPYSSS